MAEETLMTIVNEQQGLSLKLKHRRELLACYPHPAFPTISITGSKCALSCKHCGRHYLKNMLACTTPEELYKKCLELSLKGAFGVLLSGGFNEEGYVPFEPFLDVIRKVKDRTGIFISTHTGLVPEWLAKEMGIAGVDLADYDLIGSEDTIKSVLGIEKKVNDYRSSLKSLARHIPYVVPHICIGLHFGELRGEFRALELASEVNPYLLVLLVLAPTPGTGFGELEPPSASVFKKVAIKARTMFPEIDISLGCMRPRFQDRLGLELAALEAGIDRIELPAQKTLEAARRMGLTVKKLYACCSVPESVVKSSFEPNS
ncbi:MAG: radical SAM protein [Candidatus Hadarchaeum sp.]|uniref:radical SAM protein n=1 Tax=Candidatus Hadarchaeum sp. TaxID=2883567 RepID=UPI003D0B3010